MAKQNKLKRDEIVDFRKLTDFIRDEYKEHGIEPSWNLLMTQVKNMVKNYDITYIGILNVLKYMTQIEDIDITSFDTLGLVPYYIDRTNRYIEKYKAVKKSIDDFDFTEEVEFIKPIKQSKRRERKNETFE